MQLRFCMEVVKSKKKKSNPDGKGMFVDVYLLQKQVHVLKGGAGDSLVKILWCSFFPLL